MRSVNFALLLTQVVSIFSFVSANVCNGNAAYCNRLYSDVSQIGTHDSAFVGPLPQDNQEDTVTQQLNAGIRFLQAQTHFFAGELSLCHTSCWELYAGPLVDYLSSVKTWLDANPNEVLTILLTNGDNVDISMMDQAYKAAGLDTYAYIPPTTPNTLPIDAWPTLQQLIDAKTRLVAFQDYGADTTRVPYILPEFSYFFETPFDTTDPTFNECSLDRPAGASPNGLMYIVNHFLDVSLFGILVPDDAADYTTNAASGSGSIGAQVGLCEGIYGRAPKGVLVDYFDKGDVFTAERSINGV